ncbi:hypothetical protein [Acinetobacter baumannii]|uniref:hypothetical protein n=1 Tax=Acinetobacter baumannii TaxID=470 RepID=UPI001900F11D|nr:hypothetical protein [Acinetobacter baumannii]MBJ9481186.1 hypothetical protein [Acinetobacter baumannii]MBJ9910062.1 hypothetical protein [Acinetobacter baumannii]MBJ9944549.1 hypothetical protein [Acinetobacter baumannii]
MRVNNQNEPVLFGAMTYSQIMRLRSAYELGVRDAETRQANSLYQKLKRRGWLKRLKERKAMTGHDKEAV